MFRKFAAFSAILVFVLGSASAAGAQTFYSSQNKYSERFPAWFGTSSSVKLTARMLYAADGTTELVATTGDIDSTTPGPGTLIGLFMTAVDGRGRVVYNKLFINTNSTGRLVKAFTGFVPGQPFFLQGIVTQKDKYGRLGLYYVNVNVRVQKRPDLYVHDVVAPVRAPVHLPVQVTAVVSELNGYVGARADCVMYVDDVEVDRAPGIWVDSGDAVSCAFSTTFSTVGLHTVKVAAESVKPAEWSAGNNQASVSVDVFAPEFDAINAAGVYFDLDRVGTKDYGRYVNSTLTTGGDFLVESLRTAVGDTFEYAAIKANVRGAPTQITVTATDGTTSWSVQRPINACAALDVGTEGGRTYWTYVVGCNGALWAQAGSNAGTVTYTSRTWSQTFKILNGLPVFDAPTEYIENRTEVFGTPVLSGTTWTLDVEVIADGVAYHGPVTFDVVTPFDRGAVTTTCTSQPLLVYCTDSGWRQAGRFGQFQKAWTNPIPPGIEN